MLTLFPTTSKLLRGESYWQVVLSSGKILTEGAPTFDFVRGTRSIDWYLDLVGNNECKSIKKLSLCMPTETLTLEIFEPYSAFQLHQGTKMMLTGGNIHNAHIIGRVDDKSTGACTAIIWDIIERKSYTFQTTIFSFGAWREDIIPIGLLNYNDMGVRL